MSAISATEYGLERLNVGDAEWPEWEGKRSGGFWWHWCVKCDYGIGIYRFRLPA